MTNERIAEIRAKAEADINERCVVPVDTVWGYVDELLAHIDALSARLAQIRPDAALGESVRKLGPHVNITRIHNHRWSCLSFTNRECIDNISDTLDAAVAKAARAAGLEEA